MDVVAIRSAIQSRTATKTARDWAPLLILFLPSVYILLTVPPLWRDSDGFNEIASTFAPKGIIHWLPGYCFCGRLIVILFGIAGNLLQGRGLPPLSISITPLNDLGVYALIVFQHLFLVCSLYYFVSNATDRPRSRVLCAAFFALTPWMYVYANCIGSEAFSNPLIVLVAALGRNCLEAPELGVRNLLPYLALLVAASLTRQINGLLVGLLPLALVPGAVGELLQVARRGLAGGLSRLYYSRKLLIFVGIAVIAIGLSIFVQQAMCWICRVPFRSALGQTFEWRLAYWSDLPEAQRSLIIRRIDAKIADPVVTDALEGLDQSLNHGDGWKNMFLFYRIDETLVRSGLKDMQLRTWQIDLKLNRIALAVLRSMEPHYLGAVWSDFMRAPFFSQSDLAYSPFILTDWLQTQLAYPRYGRLRGLASFQHEPGYYEALWKRTSYLHLLGGVPMVWMVFATGALSLVGFALASARDLAGLRTSFSAALVATGLLMLFGSCLTTFSAARFNLPVYSLFQMALIFGGLTAAAGLIERLETLQKSS